MDEKTQSRKVDNETLTVVSLVTGYVDKFVKLRLRVVN